MGGPVLLLVEPRIVAGIHRLEHRYIAGVLVRGSARYMCLAVYKSHLLHCLASAHLHQQVCRFLVKAAVLPVHHA